MSHGLVDLGDVTVSRVQESYGPAAPASLLVPSYDPAMRAEFGADTIAKFVVPETDYLLLSMHTWVIRTPQKTILVDTCNGNHKRRNPPNIGMLDTDWLDQLIAAGVTPDEVDAVVCTHLHADHVGWNTTLLDGEWVPTFPNARYYFNKTEYEFWSAEHPFNGFVFDDSVKPVFDRGLAELWDGDGCDVDDYLRLAAEPRTHPRPQRRLADRVAWLWGVLG